MGIAEKLDIFLITYNRAPYLKRTLEQLFSAESPIKNFPITIIDNNSTDSTADVIKSFQAKFPNIIYKKNKINIGGNGNIARTFELAQKEYIWILCDDDNYCWDSWSDVEKYVEAGAEAIVVGGVDYPKVGIANLFAQTTFLPGVIYKTSNIDETVIVNMQYNISNMFPHLALSSKLINENKEFKITTSEIVTYYGQNEMPIEKTYVRGYNPEELHPLMRNLNYLSAYANSLHMIKDKKLRNILATKRRFFYMSNLNSAKIFFFNAAIYKNSLYNLVCIFCALSTFEKFRFLINWILFYTLYRLVYIYNDEIYNENTFETIKTFKIRLFYFLKTNLFKIRFKEQGVM